MANVLIRTVDHYDLRNKVGWFTADNAANNGVALREFGKLLHDPLFDAKQRYIRYVHLDSQSTLVAQNKTLIHIQ